MLCFFHSFITYLSTLDFPIYLAADYFSLESFQWGFVKSLWKLKPIMSTRSPFSTYQMTPSKKPSWCLWGRTSFCKLELCWLYWKGCIYPRGCSDPCSSSTSVSGTDSRLTDLESCDLTGSLVGFLLLLWQMEELVLVLIWFLFFLASCSSNPFLANSVIFLYAIQCSLCSYLYSLLRHTCSF